MVRFQILRAVGPHHPVGTGNAGKGACVPGEMHFYTQSRAKKDNLFRWSKESACGLLYAASASSYCLLPVKFWSELGPKWSYTMLSGVKL